MISTDCKSTLPMSMEEAHHEIVELRKFKSEYEQRRAALVVEVENTAQKSLGAPFYQLSQLTSLVDQFGGNHELPSNGIIGLYFAGNWCPACKKFSVELSEFLRDNRDKDFQIVLVSHDHSPKEFGASQAYDNFLSVPWEDHAIRASITTACGVVMFPSLVIIDPGSKRLVTRFGVSAIQCEKFPGQTMAAWKDGRSGYFPAWLERRRTLAFNPLGCLAWTLTVLAVLHFVFGFTWSSAWYYCMSMLHSSSSSSSSSSTSTAFTAQS